MKEVNQDYRPKFYPGDVVMLYSGGYEMTVLEEKRHGIRPEPTGIFYCVYWDEKSTRYPDGRIETNKAPTYNFFRQELLTLIKRSEEFLPGRDPRLAI